MKRPAMPPSTAYLERSAGMPGGQGLRRRVPLPQVSAKRRAENRQAAAKTAPRAKQGSVRAAVALVLAGETTCAQAARMCGLGENGTAKVKVAAAREFRRLVMERDGWECGAKAEGCEGAASDVQHRQKKRAGGTSDPLTAFSPVNGAAMCRPCHDRADRGYDEGLHSRGFWLESGEDPALVPLVVATEYGPERRWLLADGSYSLEAPEGTAAA